MRRALAAAAATAALSLLLVAPAPAYDAWMWLLWGREVAAGALDTREGPAFKPLPVAVCALLAPLGAGAPTAWVLLVRTALGVAAWQAWRLGRELSGGSRLGGALAAIGVLLCGSLLSLSAAGAEPALVLAAALAGAAAWRAGRPRAALACAAACALLRVEAWPLLLAASVVLWRRAPAHRPALAVVAVVVPLAWFVPEWLGSGDALRSGTRARVPNPGQPALSAVPALASLRTSVVLPPWPLWLGVGALAVAAARGRDRAALLPAGVGIAWLLVVAAMAQAGFSGETRYALPGAALVAISGAAGLALAARRHSAALAVVALLAIPVAVRAADLPALRDEQAHRQQLAGRLPAAIRAAGGRAAVLRCGTPYVGPLRGPLLAYALRVPKPDVEPDARPRPPGTVFRARLAPAARPVPAAGAGFRVTARTPPWVVLRACRS